MIKSVAALKLFASSMQDEDILRSLYVLSFNDIPNKDFSIKEAITRRADAKEKLNLVERQLIAKEVCTVLKNASALFDSELANITNNDNDFIQPKNPEFIKSAKFGLLANVNGKYHLVNPLTNRVASEFIIEAADERYAKLHELVGQYRKENKISYFDESDGMMVLTGSPEVINDLEHKVKDIGYYCEAVDEETGSEGEIPEYSLKVFIDKVASKEDSVEKKADPDKYLPDTWGSDTIFDGENLRVDVTVSGLSYANESGRYPGGYSFYNSYNKLIAKQNIYTNNDGYALGGIEFFDADVNKPLPKTLEYNEPTYSKFGISEDTWAEALQAVQNDFQKRYEEASPAQDLKGLNVKYTDDTNPNLKKDNPNFKLSNEMDSNLEKTTSKTISLQASESLNKYGEVVYSDDDGYYITIHTEDDSDSGIVVFMCWLFKKSEKYPMEDIVTFESVSDSNFKNNKINFANKLSADDMSNFGLTNEKLSQLSDVANEYISNKIDGNSSKKSEELVNDIDKESKVVKKDDKYQAQSEKGKNFGTYDTKEEAENRVKQMEMFKHMDKDASKEIPMFVVDASEVENVKVYADNKLIGTCKTVSAAFEKVEEKIDFEKELMEAYSIVQKDYSYRAAEADKSVNASAKVTAKVDFNKLLQNKTFKDADDLENTIKSFVVGGKVLEDDADGFTIEALEEDGKHTYKVYLIGNGGPSEEVRVEKVEELTAQEEKPVEKKADEEKLQPGEQWATDEDMNHLMGWDVVEGNDYYQIYKHFEKNTYKIWDIDKKDWYDGQEITDLPTAEKEIENLAEGLPEKTSEEKPAVEKKAEEKIDFEKELMEAGESKGEKDKVNKEQLEMGKKVEKEHTTNPEIAEKITRDHLAEIPDYYTHLKEMEDNAKKNNEVKSSYAPFITIDATTTDEVKVVAGEKVVGTCKTIQAAFEKSADWSSEELLIDDGTGVTVTYQVYDDESELPVVWAALRHRDNGNVIMCSDAVYVGDLLGAEDHIDFIKDIKDFSKEFAKVGLDEEKVQHYQDQTNAKLKEIFQPQPGPDGGAAEVVESAKQEEYIEKKADGEEDNVWVVEKTSAPTIDDQLTLDIFYVVNKNTNVVAHDAGFEPFLFPTQEDAQKHADKLNSQKEASAKEESIEKKADDQELKQFDMKQELDGQKEFETQDDSLKDVSVPEEKEDTSEVNEAMSAKPTQNKGESFSASEFGNNLAYIKQNNPEDFESIMANLKQLMVGDQKPMYDFLELWSQNNFQNFTETTRVDPTYERHSQYQEQLKNNVLPKVMEMSEYKKAMEEKVSAEKGA